MTADTSTAEAAILRGGFVLIGPGQGFVIELSLNEEERNTLTLSSITFDVTKFDEAQLQIEDSSGAEVFDGTVCQYVIYVFHLEYTKVMHCSLCHLLTSIFHKPFPVQISLFQTITCIINKS